MAPLRCLVVYMSFCWLTFAAGGKDPLVCFEPAMDMGVNEYAEVISASPFLFVRGIAVLWTFSVGILLDVHEMLADCHGSSSE